MFRARIFPLVGVVAAVALSVLPADADQRGGRRDGGSGQPQATPPPDAGRHAVPRPVDGGPPPSGAGRDVVVMTPGVGAQRHRPPYGYPGPVYGTYRHPVYNSFRGPFYGPYPGPRLRLAVPLLASGPPVPAAHDSRHRLLRRVRGPVPEFRLRRLLSLLRRRVRVSRALPGSVSGALPFPLPVNRLPRLQLLRVSRDRSVRGRRPRRAASRWCRGPRLPGRWPTEASASR